jgi:hypothetical protein
MSNCRYMKYTDSGTEFIHFYPECEGDTFLRAVGDSQQGVVLQVGHWAGANNSYP